MGSQENPRLFVLPEKNSPDIPKFVECQLDKVPIEVEEDIQAEMRRLEASRAKRLANPLVADFGDSGKVYAMGYVQTIHSEGYSEVTKSVYTVDVRNSGRIMGRGVSAIDLAEDGQETEGPYVEFTSTEEGFLKLGLGIRRLIMLNEANKIFFNKRLSSGSLASPYAEQMWKRLAERGYAAQDEQGGYSFII